MICQYFVTCDKFQTFHYLGTWGEEESRPLFKHPSACPTGPCGEEEGPRGVPNLPKEEKKEEDYEEKDEDDKEKKEDYEEKEEREGKRRDEEEMQGSLVVDDFLFVPLPFVSFPCITKHLAKLLYQLIYRTHIIDIFIEFFKAFS